MPATPEAISFISQHEGGLAADGTNLGIAPGTYNALAASIGVTNPLNALTAADQQAFINYFWQQGGFDGFSNQAIADAFFDWYWMGPKYSSQRISEALNSMFGSTLDTTVSGMTPAIIEEINSIPNQQGVYDAINTARLQYFNDLANSNTTYAQYLNGWLNRANDAYATFQPYISTTTTGADISVGTGTQVDTSTGADTDTVNQLSLVPSGWLGWLIMAVLAGGVAYGTWYEDKKKKQRPVYYLDGNSRKKNKKQKDRDTL